MPTIKPGDGSPTNYLQELEAKTSAAYSAAVAEAAETFAKVKIAPAVIPPRPAKEKK